MEQPFSENLEEAITITTSQKKWYEQFWFTHLFFRPRTFFTEYAEIENPVRIIVLTLTVGIVSYLSTLEDIFSVLKQLPENDFTNLFLWHDWTAFWMYGLLFGMTAGVFIYVFGGWFYRLRIWLAGGGFPDMYLVRRIYIYSCCIVTVPAFILYLLYTMLITSPSPLFVSEEWKYFLPFLFLVPFDFYYLYVLYRGTRSCFSVNFGRSVFLFFLLPVMGMFFLLLVASAFFILDKTEITIGKPTAVVVGDFSFDCPSNWAWEKKEEDGETTITIGMDMTDGSIQVILYNTPIDPLKKITELTMKYDNFDSVEKKKFKTWGKHSGEGFSFMTESEGVSYQERYFASSGKNCGFAMWWSVDIEELNEVKIGLKMIEDSFVMKK